MEALKPESRLFVDIVDAIREDHTNAAHSSIASEEIRADLIDSIDCECAKLIEFLSATQIIAEISPRSKDSIIGVGEKLSCLFMTALLKDLVRHFLG